MRERDGLPKHTLGPQALLKMDIAHSDDFRWFGSENFLHKWDALVKNFNAHKYTVTDCTDITRDADFNYYMDQTRMITEIIKEAKLTEAKDERLPYPIGNDPMSKADSATEEQNLNALSTHTVG